MKTIKPADISPLEQALAEDFRLTANDETKPKKHPLWQRVVGGVAAAALYMVTLLGAGAALPSCDNGNGGVDNTPVAVSGSATDGPYVNGSEVTIVELTGSLAPTTNTIIQWTDDLGRYSAELSRNTNYMGSVDGFNFDEITGRPSTAPVNLRGFFRTGSSPGAQYNINDVTHLIAERVKHLVDSGTDFDDADTQALDELLAELDMIISVPGCHAYEMDIISGANDCDNFLLAVEILVRGYAHAHAAESGDPVDATLQDIINSAALYFRNSGTMSDTFKEGLRQAAMATDITQAVQNLTDYFAARGLGTVPDADAVIDSDLDGTANSLDDDIDGDGVLNADDANPRDPSMGLAEWCDVDLCWEAYPPSGLYSVDEATAYCATKGPDWRTPTIDDLRSLVRGCLQNETGGACLVTDGCGSDCYNADICLACSGSGPDDAGCYWDPALSGECHRESYLSSSRLSDDTSAVWAMNFEAGSIEMELDVDHMLRCVRPR